MLNIDQRGVRLLSQRGHQIPSGAVVFIYMKAAQIKNRPKAVSIEWLGYVLPLMSQTNSQVQRFLT
jgi:hypothetical protein